MTKPYGCGLFVFQRDLRLEDQRGLSAALAQCETLYIVGIHDIKRSKLSLERLDKGFNLRTRLSCLLNLSDDVKSQLATDSSPLVVLLGDTVEIIRSLTLQEGLKIEAVYANAVMEPDYLSAYQMLSQILTVDLKLFKDHEVLSETQLLTQTGGPYKVFTPFYKVWRQRLNPLYYGNCELPKHWQLQVKMLSEADFDPVISEAHQLWLKMAEQLKAKSYLNHEARSDAAQSLWQRFKEEGIHAYDQLRDYPAEKGTSDMALYLNNGLISYRQLVRESLELGAEAYLRQLAWRHFYMLILFHFPRVEKEAFIQSFTHLPWENDPSKIEAWLTGTTGFGIVDAAMRELKETGKMHNRLRMIAASFLVKHLDVNWQIGEAYFYEMLMDGDLALNNGGWQWCASTGNDAQPYFRIFNPLRQAETYDPQGRYQSTWLPKDSEYSAIMPIVSLKAEGQKALLKYKLAKKGSDSSEDYGSKE